jgi:hypothetical protein
MIVKELVALLLEQDQDTNVVLLNDITFTADTYRAPELSQEFPYKVENIETVTGGKDRGKDVVFIHAVGANLF